MLADNLIEGTRLKLLQICEPFHHGQPIRRVGPNPINYNYHPHRLGEEFFSTLPVTVMMRYGDT